MASDLDRMLEKLQKQREEIAQQFGDSTASQHRTEQILDKLEELRRRATQVQNLVPPAHREE